jgi:hypothetical protein
MTAPGAAELALSEPYSDRADQLPASLVFGADAAAAIDRAAAAAGQWWPVQT